jgi:Zn-dependent oligopeptidase
MGQSGPRYKALIALKSNTDYWSTLDDVQRRVIDKEIRSMKNAGVGFTQDSIEKNRFNEISERLSKLKLNFKNNVLDSTKDYQLHVLDKQELDGCPEALLESMRKGALEAGHKEGYCITLDFPTFSTFMKSCTNAKFREMVEKGN